MRKITSTILFAFFTLVIAIVGDHLFSLVSGLESGQAFLAALSWLGIVFGFHKYIATRDTGSEPADPDDENNGEGTAAQHPNAPYQTQSAPRGSKADDNLAATTDTGQDLGTTDDPGPTPDPEPRDRSGLRRSNDEILEDVGEQLADYLTLYDDGTIDLDADDLDLYSQMMLYVVANRLAYEDRLLSTAAVTVNDLQDQFKYNKIEMLLFHREARTWLVPADEQSPSIGTIDYEHLAEVAVTVKTRSLSEIADWILEDKQPYPSDVAHGVSNAGIALGVAETQYEKAKEKAADQYSAGAETHYAQVRQKVQRACIDASDYPVTFGRDMAWTDFTKYAEALLDYMDAGYPGKISHCLPRMQRYQGTMEEQVDDVTYR